MDPAVPDGAQRARRAPGLDPGRWRRLRLAAVLAPVLFIVGLQLLRPLVSENPLPDTGQALLDALTAVAAVIFGLVMFRKLDAWNTVVLHTNRELAMRDALATAVRAAGSTAPSAVAVAAARSLQRSTGATSVVVSTEDAAWDVHGRLDGRGDQPGTLLDADEYTWDEADETTPALTAPLTAAETMVGTLRMTLPPEAGLPQLTASTLEAIGQQIGSALHRAVLQARLERTLENQRAVSDLLVQITSVPDTERGLLSVVDAARRLTEADAAGLRLRAGAVPALHAPPSAGHVCVTDAVHPCSPAARTCAHRVERPGALPALPVRGIDGVLGELWVGLTAEEVDDSDRAVLADLAELASVTVEHSRLLEDERGAAAVREREWIARELHDSLAQVLGVLHLRLRSLEAMAAALPVEQSRQEMTELADIAHDAFVDVREAILGLRESSAGDRSFLDALRSYAAKYQHQSGVRAQVRTEGEIDLAPAAEVQVLRVVQEALTNVRKHARAEQALVDIRREGASVVLEVRDDGAGFEVDAEHSVDSFGLSSMRERCELVGGTLHLTSALGEGTTVTARVPAGGTLAVSEGGHR